MGAPRFMLTKIRCNRATWVAAAACYATFQKLIQKTITESLCSPGENTHTNKTDKYMAGNARLQASLYSWTGSNTNALPASALNPKP